MPHSQHVSSAVIRRLPRYYRFLGELVEKGITRISSKELAEMMSLTASQIRQDLNCFGGFGQQGYGYNVPLLHAEIRRILGLSQGFPAILVGVGNLGRAFGNHIDFAGAGFHLCAAFDKSPDVIGKKVANLVIRDADQIEEFCQHNRVDVAILCVPNEVAQTTAERLIKCGIGSFWNFTHYDIKVAHPELVVENTHLVDGLMALCYLVNDRKNNDSCDS